MKKYSPELVEAIKAHIKEQDLRMVAFDEELGSFSFNMQLSAELASANVIIRVREDEFTTLAICPVRPNTNDKEQLAKMSEFVCRANYGLRNGGFEFDFNDGELRYKCYVPCGEQIPSQELIRRSIATPALMLRRYSPGIIGVLYNHRDPAEMIQECEGDSIGRRVYGEMSRGRDALRERLGIKPSAEKSDELLSFDEFVSMDSEAHADPESDSNGENNSGSSEE